MVVDHADETIDERATMPRKENTMKGSLLKGIRNAVLLEGIVAVAIIAACHSMPQADSTKGDVMDGRTSAPHSPTAVWDAHAKDCWKGGEAPKAEIPGHVVVQFIDGTTKYLGAKATGRALDMLFADGDWDVNVIGFCK